MTSESTSLPGQKPTGHGGALDHRRGGTRARPDRERARPHGAGGDHRLAAIILSCQFMHINGEPAASIAVHGEVSAVPDLRSFETDRPALDDAARPEPPGQVPDPARYRGLTTGAARDLASDCKADRCGFAVADLPGILSCRSMHINLERRSTAESRPLAPPLLPTSWLRARHRWPVRLLPGQNVDQLRPTKERSTAWRRWPRLRLARRAQPASGILRSFPTSREDSTRTSRSLTESGSATSLLVDGEFVQRLDQALVALPDQLERALGILRVRHFFRLVDDVAEVVDHQGPPVRHRR